MMADFALNRLSPVDQRATFARLGPESGRAIFELFFWIFDDRHTTRIDYEQVTCPVLVVSGSDDRGVSGHTARQIATRHGANATFFEATGFGHYLMLESGWQAVATRCADWMSAACESSG
jgi:pimeloyl-ACP methyl ester carboxylesterase